MKPEMNFNSYEKHTLNSLLSEVTACFLMINCIIILLSTAVK